MMAEIMVHGGMEAVGREMHRAVRAHSADLGKLAGLGLEEFFAMVRNIRYADDESLFATSSVELTPGPQTILRMPAIDCKKKAILMASWAKENGVPFRFVAVCEDGTGIAHHVFVQFPGLLHWKNIDATLPEYRIGDDKPLVTHAWILGE